MRDGAFMLGLARAIVGPKALNVEVASLVVL